MDVRGSKVLVTGAASGMGRVFALELAKAGASVAACDLNLAGAQETAGMAKGIVALEADVSKEDQVQGVIKKAAEALGGLNVLVNNAGPLQGRAPRQGRQGLGRDQAHVARELAEGDRRRPHRPVPLHARVRCALHRDEDPARRRREHLVDRALRKRRAVELLRRQGGPRRRHRSLGEGARALRHPHGCHRAGLRRHADPPGHEARGARRHAQARPAPPRREARGDLPRGEVHHRVRLLHRAAASTSTAACASDSRWI